MHYTKVLYSIQKSYCVLRIDSGIYMEEMNESLRVLFNNRCIERWSAKINLEKREVMHMRGGGLRGLGKVLF